MCVCVDGYNGPRLLSTIVGRREICMQRMRKESSLGTRVCPAQWSQSAQMVVAITTERKRKEKELKSVRKKLVNFEEKNKNSFSGLSFIDIWEMTVPKMASGWK